MEDQSLTLMERARLNEEKELENDKIYSLAGVLRRMKIAKLKYD
jgi:hypothetical protein